MNKNKKIITQDYEEIDYLKDEHIIKNSDKDILIIIPKMLGNVLEQGSSKFKYKFTVHAEAIKDKYLLIFTHGNIIIEAPQQIKMGLIEEKRMPILKNNKDCKIEFLAINVYQITIDRNTTLTFYKTSNDEVCWE
jgi:hypothetical protein